MWDYTTEKVLTLEYVPGKSLLFLVIEISISNSVLLHERLFGRPFMK